MLLLLFRALVLICSWGQVFYITILMTAESLKVSCGRHSSPSFSSALPQLSPSYLRGAYHESFAYLVKPYLWMLYSVKWYTSEILQDAYGS